MYDQNNMDELQHYGVKGMKWGVRRAKEVKAVNNAYKQRKKKLDADFNKAYNAASKQHNRSLPFTQKRKQALKGMADAGWKYNKAKEALDKEYKTKFKKAATAADKRMTAEKVKKKLEKQKYKDTIKQMRKEINNGASLVGKIYNKITNADLYEAQTLYNLGTRPKSQKRK